ncbi:hypothetical protein EFL96_06285 [Lactococcus lactis]|nr:hypothetical protein [Lactococcus lactis]MCT1189561.1 hypothetical protein [Lactococcus lactis]
MKSALCPKLASLENEATSKPDNSWTVTNIKAWLDSHSISYTSSNNKAELLALVV